MDEVNSEVSDTVPSEPSAPPPPRKITLEDRQSVELLYVKIENLKLQQRILQGDLVKSSEMIQGLQKELMSKSEEFQKKYGVVLGRDQIAADGTIVPVNPPTNPPQGA